ncbi:MAG: TraB/GumN family protein [Thermodesulfobacteriota bacterium]
MALERGSTLKVTRPASLYRPAILAGLALAFLLLWPRTVPAGNFLWMVSSPEGKAYLVGSMHAAKPDLYPLPEPFYRAFQDAEVLAVELDVLVVDQERMQAKIQELGLYAPGDDVFKHASARTLAWLKKIKLDPQMNRFRPWLLAEILQLQALQSLGFSEQLGVDRHFLERAASSGMTVVEMESLDFQVRLFADMSETEQDAFLYYTLAELDDTQAQMNDLLQSWRRGDAEGFSRTVFEDLKKYPELRGYFEKVLFKRNEGMTALIEQYLRSGRTHFVIAGAAHLVGPRGIIARLKEKGFRVDQL